MDLTKDDLFNLATALLTRMCHCTDKLLELPLGEDRDFWHREWQRAADLQLRAWARYKALS